MYIYIYIWIANSVLECVITHHAFIYILRFLLHGRTPARCPSTRWGVHALSCSFFGHSSQKTSDEHWHPSIEPHKNIQKSIYDWFEARFSEGVPSMMGWTQPLVHSLRRNVAGRPRLTWAATSSSTGTPPARCLGKRNGRSWESQI